MAGHALVQIGQVFVTNACFALFAAVKGWALYVLIAVEGQPPAQALPQIRDSKTQALFAAVISLWFGQRALAKARGR